MVRGIAAGAEMGLCSAVAAGLKSRLWVRAAKSAAPQFLLRLNLEVLGRLVSGSVRHKSRPDPTQ